MIGRGLRLISGMIAAGAAGTVSIFTGLYAQGEDWILDKKRASYGIAVTRMLLGGSMLGTLLTNFDTRFYTFGAGMAWTGQIQYPTSDFMKIWPFGIFNATTGNTPVFTGLYLLCMVAATSFIIGYRTRISSIVLFVLWVGLIGSNTYVNDQSDNLTRIALIVTFFVALSDRWSLDARRRARFEAKRPTRIGRLWIVRWWRFQRVLPEWFTTVFHNFAIIALACQVSFIYVSGGLYKAGGAPWSGGYAIYDPIHVVQFAPWPELSQFVTDWGPGVAFATVLTLTVQISFPLLLLRRGTRIFALIVMLSFHIGIAVLMGLPWFSLAMIALDAIFIRDVTWVEARDGLKRKWRSTRLPSPEEKSTQEPPVLHERDPEKVGVGV